MPALILGFALLLTQSAHAHGGAAHDALGWTFDPWIVTPILLMASLHGAGMLRLRLRRGLLSRGNSRRGLVFWAGLACLAGALMSPLHEYGEHLFTLHMIEHELVVAVAAPLIVLGRPIAPMLWALPRRARAALAQGLRSRALRLSWRAGTTPAVATFLHALALWIWHAPPLFDATVTHGALHRLQHLSFFGTAILFWWAMLWRASRGTAAWHQFVTMLHTSVLGALIALAPTVLYQAQTRYALEWGLSPLEDQQLAGIVMWVPGGLVYAGAALWFLATWIRTASKGGLDGTRIGLA
ncbi:hypothetical protein BJF93_13930 [Xaviernesmea oryzae]|uniref:Cytochrome c oxidase assembly protein n=1 Tax=Xaviernesmea oryzae TaxID=464029 RepID=A0A1Q9AR81_9HYPH|nr:cytochrome c oxidase assembly protein [Xaviernesmea oryzae]OLP57932.1 hypothetical protein BJF93_13930 [Xaviernesmea oryzae]SEL30240.1 Cytochrome c oxidase assembly factor CtaG [Xaviernesmea oryzae]